MISLQNIEPALTPSVAVQNSAAGDCPLMADTVVGAVLPDQSTVEQELDAAIAELDRASVKAMADGDPQGAALYAKRMYEAIRSRTPEHQQRLHAEVNARIADEMTFGGRWTTEVLNRTASHFNVSAQAVRRRMA